MKAIRVREFGGPEVLQIDEVPDLTPGPDDVVVRVRAAGVNPVDAYIRSGTYARLPQLPFTPGTDAAGTIDAVGARVEGLTAGQRVYVAGLGFRHTGTYAECVRCEPAAVRPLPPAVSFSAGAAIGVPYLTAARALFNRAQIQPGETVLVHGGSGGVGLAALQFSKAVGAKAIGTAGSERGLALVGAQGAVPLNHTTGGYEARVRDLTHGRGVDVVIEMLANVNLVRDFDMLATGGRIVVVGNRGALEFNPRLTMAKEAAILGTMLWNLSPDVRERLMLRVDAGLASGVLNPVVGRELALADAAEAHRAVLAAGAAGKIVLVP